MTNQRSCGPLDILLVEDNPGDVRLTEEAFKAADLEVSIHAVTDGDDALEFLTECRKSGSVPYPDMVLLDLNLPRMNGFEVLEAIREDPDLALLPVLVLTSSEADEDIARSYELSANAYLTKPNRPDEFESLARTVEEFWFERTQLPPIPT